MPSRPPAYRYISARLLGDLVLSDQARRSRFRVTPGASVGGVGFQVSRNAVDVQNNFALARRADRLIKDHTYDVAAVSAGDYLREALDLHYGVLKPLMGWPGGEVACYWAETSTPAGVRTFVALFGSAANVVG